jgi:hypothetical protein
MAITRVNIPKRKMFTESVTDSHNVKELNFRLQNVGLCATYDTKEMRMTHTMLLLTIGA